MAATELADGLAEVLAPALGPVEVADLRRLTAGANRETWSFDAVPTAGAVQSLIVQVERAGGAPPTGAGEAQVLRAAGAGGAPVPTVVAAGEAPNPLGRRFVITRRLEGETIPRRLLRDERWSTARERFVDDCARALARIHRIPLDGPGIDLLPVIEDPLGPLGASYESLGDAHPVLDLALRWLDHNRPEPRAHAVTHGDFRLGNLLLGTDGLAAVLDWELASVGDPNVDLGWLCVRAWRFGAPGRVAGLGSEDDLLAAYNAAAGTAVTAATLRWWELYGTLRWGVICLQMGAGFRLGLSASIEMGMIGRRVVENESDIVGLLREVGAGAPPVGEGSPRAKAAASEVGDPEGLERASAPLDAPAAAPLVDAVATWLRDDLLPRSEGADRWTLRVAANALTVAAREIVDGPAAVAAHRERLGALGFEDEGTLSQALRRGALDDRLDEVLEALAPGVSASLAIANPEY